MIQLYIMKMLLYNIYKTGSVRETMIPYKIQNKLINFIVKLSIRQSINLKSLKGFFFFLLLIILALVKSFILTDFKKHSTSLH